MESTDALAAHRTVRQVADLLQRGDDRDYDLDDSVDVDELARLVVDGFTVLYERRDGQRRPVLCGPWEVDPEPAGKPARRG